MVDESTANELPETGGFQGQSLTHGSGSLHSWGQEIAPLPPLPEVELPGWAFDEAKLRRLLLRRYSAFAAVCARSDELQIARGAASRLRSQINDGRARKGTEPTERQLTELARADARAKVLAGEVAELSEAAQSVGQVVDRCCEWAAQTHRWSEDGEGFGPEHPLQTIPGNPPGY